MGTSALRVVQFGRESTWGTPVAAAAIMSGVTNVTAQANVVNNAFRVLDGSFSPSTQMIQTYASGAAMIEGLLTPEDILYVLDSAVVGSVSPTGAGPYVWTYNFPTTTTGSIRSRTLEFSDNQQAWEMDGSIVESFAIAAEAGDGEDAFTKLTSNWKGQALTSTTLTGSLSARTYNVIPANTYRFYADAYAGTIGTTELTNTLIGFSFECNTGKHLKKFMTGTTTPDSFGYNLMDITLTCTVEYNANGDTLYDNYVAGTTQLFRIVGTGASSTAFTIDVAGVPISASELWGDRDGNTTVELTYKPRYDAGPFANYARIQVTNNVSALVTNA